MVQDRTKVAIGDKLHTSFKLELNTVTLDDFEQPLCTLYMCVTECITQI